MKLTILTADMWLLVPPFMKDNNLRLGELIEIIKKRKPDVVFLQEVWLKKYVWRLRAELPEYSLVAYCTLKKGWMGKMNPFNRSGLVTLSRQSIKASRLIAFERSNKHSLVERFAKKGVLVSELNVPYQHITAFNMHVYAWTTKAEEQITLDQITSVRELVSKNGMAIIGGDFNTPEADVRRRVDDGFVFEQNDQVTVSSNNRYWQDPLHKILNNETIVSRGDRKIDCVIAKAGDGKQVEIKSEVVKEPLVSDHYPVWAEITIINGD